MREPAGRRGGGRTLRRDIQGLRAVAVLSVVMDHLFGWPSGGFVGVDIFFVISGFLITQLLIREWDRTGTISFKGFYARRVRRIIPASTLTLLATVLASYFIFPGSKAATVLWDGVASLGFVGNWRFASTGTDYFAQGAASPLQHFWSLGVEEQFYFVWPWMLLGILLLAARTRSDRGLHVAGLVILGVMAGSLAFAMLQSPAAPTVAYFSTLTRAWELGVGAALAVFGGLFTRLPGGVRVAMAWGGGIVIISSFLLIGPESVFPAPWAALPVLGSAMVIAAGIGEEPRANFVLTNPVSVYIGNISYSLYLWHFPVVVFGAALFPEASALYFILTLAVSILFAVLSYELVENPLNTSPLLKRFRDASDQREAWNHWFEARRARMRRVVLLLVAPSAAALLLIGFLFPPGELSGEQIAAISEANARRSAPSDGGGSAARGQTEYQDELAQGIAESLSLVSWPTSLTPSIDTVQVDGMPEEDEFGCDDPASTQCVFGDGEQKVLVYGDSLGTTLLPTVRAAYPEATVRGLTRASCAITDLDVDWKSNEERDGCLTHRQNLKDYVQEEAPDIVFVIQNYAWSQRLASKAEGPALAAEWTAADQELLAVLKSAGVGDVVFVTPPPEGKSIIDCATASSTPLSCVSDVPGYWNTLATAQRGEDGLFLDQSDWFCADGTCPVVNGTIIVRRDMVHPTRQYAVELAPYFRKRADQLVAV